MSQDLLYLKTKAIVKNITKDLNDYVQVQFSELLILDIYILHSLFQADGQLASVLARSVKAPVTTFTQTLDKLEDEGYIKRQASLADRRVVHIHLTLKAINFKEEIETLVQKAEQHTRDMLKTLI